MTPFNVWIYLAGLASVWSATNTMTSPGALQEWCQADTFQATCEESHVIVMQSATYGRMKQGKCVKGDYGHLGCSRSVQPFMDSECSGRRECRFRVFDTLRDHSPCPEDMASYLESSYTCVNVVSADRSQCLQSKPVILTSQSASLSSSTSEDTGLGTTECPWTIRASSGQRIIVSVRYFGIRQQQQQQQHIEAQRTDSVGVATSNTNRKLPPGMAVGGGGCYELATLREVFTPSAAGDSPGGGEFRSVTTCDGRIPGEHEVFRSQSHELTVTMVGRMALKTLGKFIISYRVFGCADMASPYNATMLRDGDRLTVKCNRSEQIWYLVCVNNSWHGEPINCNTGDSVAWKSKPMFDVGSFPYGILVVVAVGVALGIFCGGLLLACVVVYMKSERRQHLRQHDAQSGIDYRCDVDGYYGTAVGRRGSFDHTAPPLLTASEEELHEKTAIFGQTQTMAYPGLVHCTVGGSGVQPHQTCLPSGVGSAPRLATGQRVGYNPAPTGSDLCVDCCVGGEYDRRNRAKLTGTLCHGVDVTMTTGVGGPPGTTRLPTSGDRLPHAHVYELPHAV